MFLRFGKCYVLRPQGPRNVIQPQHVKQCYVLRDPHLRFESYAVKNNYCDLR